MKAVAGSVSWTVFEVGRVCHCLADTGMARHTPIRETMAYTSNLNESPGDTACHSLHHQALLLLLHIIPLRTRRDSPTLHKDIYFINYLL